MTAELRFLHRLFFLLIAEDKLCPQMFPFAREGDLLPRAVSTFEGDNRRFRRRRRPWTRGSG